MLNFTWYDSSDQTLKFATRNLEGQWSAIQIVDTSGDACGAYLSLKLDRDGTPSIAYFDGTAGDLKYATQDGSTWDVQTLDSKKSTGLYPSLAFDSQNHPLIAYYRKTSGDLRLATFDGSEWSWSDIDTQDDVGRSASLAIADDGTVGVAYADSTFGQLKYASSADDGQTWTLTTVDPTLGVSFISLKFDDKDRPNISYYDATPANLKYALLDSGQWSSETIDSFGAVGLYSQLIVPPGGGDLSILYFDRPRHALRLATGHFGDWTITDLQHAGGRYIAATLDRDQITIAYTWSDRAEETLAVSTV